MDERASTAVVDVLASIDEVSPCRTDFVLHDYVDPEALNDLISRNTDGPGSLQVSFQVRKYTVVVTDDGTITVTWETT